MYKKVLSDKRVVEREDLINEFWNKNDIFNKSIKLREGCPTFTFFDGPPTANGKPHIGHVITRAIKDLYPRYKTMKGYQVLRKAGWDTHGLPVELEVEKQLGFSGKEQIEKYGIAPFVDKCKESVFKYEKMWEDFSKKVAFWADMDDPYVTFHDDFIESEWWAIKQIFDKGLIYKGYKIVPYCPRCGTPLASHEVAQGYKDVKEKSCIAKFKLRDEENTFFLAWTTTPWTLPSNVSLSVNPNVEYAKVLSDNVYYIMAKDLVESVFKDKEVEIVDTFLGKTLEYKKYEPLYDFLNVYDKAYYITLADYVTTEDGTGIVHNAPPFGQDDYLVGRKYKLPWVQLVDTKGEMLECTLWPHTFVKDADPLIMKDLKERGLLFKALNFEHSYPFCWRCNTPLLYYARDSWYIEITKLKDLMVENNKKINWIPESIGEGRFGDWLENIQDWAISRNRYWGTPLPIWINDKTGEMKCIGSKEELSRLSGCDKNIELHRPYIDNVTWEDKVNGGTFRRTEEVMDVWFDSGSMPFAQYHYPFENQELFKSHYPADFISEAVDQTRGWFYVLHAISTLLFGTEAFKNCIVLGLVMDENGQKMSKSKGNAVDPMTVLNKFGADATRWFFYESSQPWVSKNISDDAILEGQKKYLNTLYNTYSFFVLYANIDNFDATKYSYDYDALAPIDKWLLSKLNTLIKFVDTKLEEYDIVSPARAIEEFVDELSNWYVRRNRERYWAKGMEKDKLDAYAVLYETLVKLSKLVAPFSPFISEEIYQNLVRSVDKNAPESIHLCDYPVSEEDKINLKLEEDMDEVLKIVTLGRSVRALKVIKNRQPLAKMYVVGGKSLNDYYASIIEDELNVKKIEYASNLDEFVSHSLKLNFRSLGPKVGKNIGLIKNELANMDQNKAYKDFINNKSLKVLDYTLTEEDLIIETHESNEYSSMSDSKITVVLDTQLTKELIDEGYVREVVSKIQQQRKEAGFEVVDHITLSFDTSDELQGIIKSYEEKISSQTLADEIVYNSLDGFTKEWDVNPYKLTIGVKKR
ncbi:MAG: isoleucine--tRNA ligase [Gammaproteobacteria bacterium]|nr:isoleucine--tRNA ligase [Gammaproteobacteria bacterium]